ncbi:MAG: hypothetical protein QOH99_916, partial [Frankiaceae bacterium]|nr:hypothetical protein [Frankiaceae bacterium]
MEHVVFYTGHDGLPSFRRVESLNEAVSLVEHLRNSKNVSDTTVYAMSAVPLDFRPYYRAEVPAEAYDAEAVPTDAVVIQAGAPDADPDDETLAVAPPLDTDTHVPAPHISLVPDLARYEGHQVHAPAPLPFAPLGFEPIALHADAPGAEPRVHIGLEADPVSPPTTGPADAAEAPESGDAPVVAAVPDDLAPLATVVQLHPTIAVEPDADALPESATDEGAGDPEVSPEAAPEAAPEEQAAAVVTEGITAEAVESATEPVAVEPEHIEAETVEHVEAVEQVEPAVAESVAVAPSVDDNDHLGALAELAAQVAEDSASDPVDDDSVEVRYEPEAFAAEAGESPHEHAEASPDSEPDIAEPEMADIEPTVEEAAAVEVETVAVTAAPEAEPQSPQPAVHGEPPVDVFVVSDE